MTRVTTQTARISLETAAGLGLVTTDDTSGETLVNEDALGSTMIFDPATLIEQTGDEEDLHPVASALSDFFGEILGVDYDTLMMNHEQGVGFGVIAQALWMTNSLGGDTATFQAILYAKESGDYSAITLPDGAIPTNWGQFRQAVFADKDKAKNNLGYVQSGRAADEMANDDSINPEKDDERGNENSHEKSSKAKGKAEEKNKNK